MFSHSSTNFPQQLYLLLASSHQPPGKTSSWPVDYPVHWKEVRKLKTLEFNIDPLESWDVPGSLVSALSWQIKLTTFPEAAGDQVHLASQHFLVVSDGWAIHGIPLLSEIALTYVPIQHHVCSPHEDSSAPWCSGIMPPEIDYIGGPAFSESWA